MLLRTILSLVASFFGYIAIIPLCIILLPFGFVALLFRIARVGKPALVTWEDIIEFDPVFGWKSRNNVNAHMELDGIYHITIGKDGWRGNYELDKSNVIVIGDSFVFGQGTDDVDYFANLTRAARVKPVGTPGYGVVHYLLLLKQFTSELKGKLVIWFVYTGNDFRESIRPTSYGYRFPFVYFDQQTKRWEIDNNPITKGKIPFNFERGYNISIPELADLFSKNYFSTYAYEAFAYLAAEAKRHCEDHGATFAVVPLPMRWCLDGNYTHKLKRNATTPADFSVEYPEQQTQKICNELGIPCPSTLNRFSTRDFLPNDLHWSRHGNEKVAQIIDELYTAGKSKI